MAEITKSKYTDLIGETIPDFPFDGIEISFKNLEEQKEKEINEIDKTEANKKEESKKR